MDAIALEDDLGKFSLRRKYAWVLVALFYGQSIQFGSHLPMIVTTPVMITVTITVTIVEKAGSLTAWNRGGHPAWVRVGHTGVSQNSLYEVLNESPT